MSMPLGQDGIETVFRKIEGHAQSFKKVSPEYTLTIAINLGNFIGLIEAESRRPGFRRGQEECNYFP